MIGMRQNAAIVVLFVECTFMQRQIMKNGMYIFLSTSVNNLFALPGRLTDKVKHMRIIRCIIRNNGKSNLLIDSVQFAEILLPKCYSSFLNQIQIFKLSIEKGGGNF